MSNFFSLENPFFEGLFKIAELIFVNLVWLIFCIPCFTAGASTAAFYYSIQKCLKNDRGTIWGCFWSSFKKNFKISVPATLIFILIAVICVMDISVLKYLAYKGVVNSIAGQIFFSVVLLVAAVYALWVFAILSRFEETGWKSAMKNGLLIGTGHFPISLAIMGITLGVCAVVYIIPYTVFIMPGAGVWFSSIMMEKVFRLYMKKEDKELDDELNMTYHNDYDKKALQDEAAEKGPKKKK